MNEKGCKEEEYFTWAWCFLMFCFRCFNTCSNQIHDLLNLFKKKRPYFILHLPEISTSSVIHMFGSHINQKFKRTTYHNRAIFCACYASTFYKILDLKTAAALKTVPFFNQVFICPLRPVLFKNHRIRWWHHNIHLNLVSILQNKSTELIRLLHASLYIWVACCPSIWVVFWRNKSLYHFFCTYFIQQQNIKSFTV